MGKWMFSLVVAALISIQSGCGIIPGVRDHMHDYQVEQPRTKPLELPDHFELRVVDELLTIPEVSRDTAIFEGSEYKMPRTQPLMTVKSKETVLLRESETDQWVLVLLPPEEVWIKLLAYFEGEQVHLVDIQPKNGIVISDWVSNTHVGEPVRVKATVQEGIRAGITEIRLFRQTKSQTDWVQVVGNVEGPKGVWKFKLDSIHEVLAASIDPADTAVSFLARNLSSGNRTHVKQTKERVPLLFIGTDFPRAWSLLAPALNDLEVKIEDKDRSAGRYYLNALNVIPLEKPGFFASMFSSANTQKPPSIWLQVKPVEGGVQVLLEIENVENKEEFNEQAETFLKDLESRLG